MKELGAYDLFREALEVEDRAAFLESCGELRDEVEELLRVHGEIDAGFLGTPAAERLSVLEPGARVGRYTVRRRIATGGGGTVFEAEQEQPRRTVALKVMRFGTDRFAEEAEILARLNHPAIATVHEAGRHDGALYIAMELVEGETLLEWARDQSPRERLRLFAQVCDAVHHGHLKGVIHRDLKPSNILVCDVGPKIIDFGIAAVEGDPGEIAGTLPYMSPEQCEGRDLDPRSDVYSLGVVLFELVSGRLPYDVSSTSITAARRIIREAEPLDLGGDLGAIVGKALAKDREDRYASASALGEDVGRYVRFEPVASRPASWPRQLALFARRRTGVAFALVALLVVLGAGVIVGTHFAVQAGAERDAAVRAREETERRAYVGQIALAQSALREHDVAEARRRLEATPERLRGWEWRHLASVLDMSERALDIGIPMFGGAATPDGRWFACACPVGRDRSAVVLVDARTYERKTWPIEQAVLLCVDLAPGASLAACGTKRGTVLLVDMADGGVRRRLEGHATHVNDVRFDAAGERVASACRDGTLCVWEVATGRLLRELRGHADRAICVRFDRAGRVISGCRDGTIRIWEGEEPVRAWRAHDGSVEGIALSPDGRRLASVSRDRTLRVWDLETLAPLATGRGHADNVRSVAWQGEVIATASYDRTVRLWSAADAAPLACLRGHQGLVRGIAFLGPTRVVSFSPDRRARVWRVAARDSVLRLRGARGEVAHVAFEGETVRGASRGGSVVWWDICGAEVERTEFGTGVVWSHADERVVRAWLSRGQMVVRSRADRKPLHGFRLVANPAWSPSERAFYSTFGGAIHRHVDGRAPTSHPGHTAKIRALALDPARPRVATGCEAGRIRIWSGDVLAGDARPIPDAVLALRFSPGGDLLAAGYGDGRVLLLSARDLAVVHRLAAHTARVSALAFHPSEPRLATGAIDATVRLWDTDTGLQVAVMRAGIPIQSVDFDARGVRLVAAGGGETGPQALVWSAPG